MLLHTILCRISYLEIPVKRDFYLVGGTDLLSYGRAEAACGARIKFALASISLKSPLLRS